MHVHVLPAALLELQVAYQDLVNNVGWDML